MSASRKRGRRTNTIAKRRQTKSQRTNNINVLCTLPDDIIQHHLWPLLTDNDAIHLMPVDRALHHYYEERAYGLKRAYCFGTDDELQRHILHVVAGAVRIAILRLWSASLSTYKSVLRAAPSLVHLTIDLEEADVMLKKLLATFIDTTPSLRELELLHLDGAMSELVPAIISHKNLATLTLMTNKISTEQIKNIARIVEHNKSITALDLDQLNDQHVVALTKALTHNTTITKLGLYHNVFRLRAATALRDAINQPHSAITALDIQFSFKDRFEKVDDCAIVLSETFSKLTSFALLEDNLTVRGVNAICNSLLKANARVSRFELYHDDAANTSIICAMIGANKTLHHITLHDTFENANDAKLLGEALKVNKTLISLNFFEELDDQSTLVSFIESALHVNHTLQSFHIEESDPSDYGYIPLALSKNRYIQQLRN